MSHVVTQVRGDFFFSFISEGHQTTSVLISLCFRFFLFFLSSDVKEVELGLF